MTEDRRLIEDYIPIAEISQESAREKSIRKGHISTLHLWWARRPLVASRAAVFASLVSAPQTEEEHKNYKQQMIDLCQWKASEITINKAKIAILEAQKQRLNLDENTPLEDVPPPKVLDLFAGGGAIPLESLRLGCETYAIDLNPVAHIIELCTLVYPQKYGEKLAQAVERWGNWVIENVRTEIGDLYPNIGELGVGNWELGISQELGGKDGQLQGTTGLAEWDRLGDGSLSSNQEVSAGGEIRTDISDSKGSNINTSKYSGGMGQRFNQRVHLSSQSSEGFSDGIGNSSDSLSTSGLSGQNQVTTISAGNNQFRENAQFTNQQSQESNITEQQLSIFPDSSNSQLPTPNSQSPKLTPVAYLWTRTVKCPNPACGADVPLVRQTWLCKKNKKYVALKIIPNHHTKKVDFKVVSATTIKDLGFDPALGSSRGNSTCHHCGTTINVKQVKTEGKAGRIGQQLMAIVCTTAGEQGKTYLSATDFQQYIPNDADIMQRLHQLCEENNLTTPNEPLPDYGVLGFRVQPYGLEKWQDLFTPRQLLSLMTFVKWVRLAHQEILKDLGINEENNLSIPDENLGENSRLNDLNLVNFSRQEKQDFAKAICTYLGLMCDKQAMFNCSLTRWFNHREGICPVFSNQALPMVWDFIEGYPLGSGSGSWESAQEYIKEVILSECKNKNFANVQRSSSMATSLENEILDAIITDPPYFDSVPYADLSDYFYVWLKRSIGIFYPQHFTAKLTPKKNEAIMEPSRHGGNKQKAAQAYQDMMHQAFKQAHRVLKSDGIMCVVYAHKTTKGWSTLIDSLRKAGFTITEAWPLDTESAGRLRAQDSAALASSIFLIARKRGGIRNRELGISNTPTPNSQLPTPNSLIGDYAMDVQPLLKQIIAERVKTLMKEGVSGADLVIACVGAGLRAYTQFDTVELPNGEELDASTFLDAVQKEVAETILIEVLNCDSKGVSAIDKATQYYILARYEYGEAVVEFDEANTLAKGVGVELDGVGGLTDGKTALVAKNKNQVQLRNYQERGQYEDLGIRSLELGKKQTFNTPTPNSQLPTPIIDILHRLLWLAEHKPSEINNYLALAQPDGNKLKLVAQSLAGRALTGNNPNTDTLTPNSQLPTPTNRSPEQQAIDTLLASWKRTIENNLFLKGGG